MQLDEIRSLGKRLVSSNWAARISAQVELDAVTEAKDWKLLLGQIPVANFPVLSLVSRRMSAQMRNLAVSEWALILAYAFTEQSPLLLHDELCRELIESFLGARKVSYRKKVDLLVEILDEATKKKKLSEELLILFIKALGNLRARRAVAHFETLINHSSLDVVHEVIRAFRLIRDRNAGKYLEKLFGAENREIATMAVSAYGDLGHGGFFHPRRLYRLYLKSGFGVRESLITVFLKCYPQLGARLLIKLYAQEKNEDLKHLILKKFASVPRADTGFLVLNAAATEETARLRTMASWSFGSLPAIAMVPAIRRGMASRKGRMKNLALLKVGELPGAMARNLLRPYLNNPASLAPMLRQTLIQSVAKLSEDRWITPWLLKQVGTDKLCSVTAVSGLVNRVNPPVEALIAKAHTLGPQSLDLVLSFVGDSPALKLDPATVLEVKKLLTHENALVRFHAARILLNQHAENCFKIAWLHALKEQLKETEFDFVTLFSIALSQEEVSPCWIARVEENLSANQIAVEKTLLLRVLSQLKTETWDVTAWAALVEFLCLHLEGTASAKTSFELNHEEIASIFASHEYFWGSILNELLLRERKPAALRLLAMLAQEHIEVITKATLNALVQLLVSGSFEDQQPVLDLLGATKERSLLDPFLGWLEKLPDGKDKAQAFDALCRWVDFAPAVSPKSRRKGVAVA